MIEKKVRPVTPVYLFAASWVVCGLILPLYALWGLVMTLAISMAVYLAATAFMPPKTILVPAPQKPFDTGEQQLDQALEQARGQLKELAALNARIPGQGISAQISRMERAGGAILGEVAKQPEKAKQIRRFLHYYLPTAVKVIASYAHMAETGAAGQNAQALKSDVEQNAQIIAAAFEKQLDSLFASEMLDITSDLDVLEHMMKGDGLAGDPPGGKDE